MAQVSPDHLLRRDLPDRDGDSDVVESPLSLREDTNVSVERRNVRAVGKSERAAVSTLPSSDAPTL